MSTHEERLAALRAYYAVGNRWRWLCALIGHQPVSIVENICCLRCDKFLGWWERGRIIWKPRA